MKRRLDVFMAETGITKSREQARALIMAGLVTVNGVKADKAGEAVADGAAVAVREHDMPFVSRGGRKLQKALETFPITLDGVIAVDIGASTGGFTDCMLQHGAKEVYAVDVGYGQLDWTLRNDPRVHVMERTNARYMEPAWFHTALGFASIDVSFISLSRMLPPLAACMHEDAQVVALIKPQFEAGRAKVGKHGVVSDSGTHIEVCQNVLAMAETAGFTPCGLTFSPIKGPKGNIEFLLWLARGPRQTAHAETIDIPAVVEHAHSECISD